ncbi:MAG TPA: type II toxin-antitoxin system HigB family toxin [Bacteroidia bacterium]|jgi:mRNA interferase HigB
MNIYNRSSIIEFYTKHGDAKIPLEVWYEEVGSKKWKSPNQLKQDYGGSVSILKNSRAVFDVKGNDYRVITAINYENGWVLIKFIGTHREYDNIDADTVDMYKPKKKKKTKTDNRKPKNGSRSNKKQKTV